MVPDQSKASIGMEYFCFKGDELWESSRRGPRRARQARDRAARPGQGRQGRARLRHARPEGLPDVRRRLLRARRRRSRAGSRASSNLQQVGRNGLHRYNNSDHSMLTAMRAVENVIARHEARPVGGQRRVGLPRGASGAGAALQARPEHAVRARAAARRRGGRRVADVCPIGRSPVRCHSDPTLRRAFGRIAPHGGGSGRIRRRRPRQ